MPDPNAFRAMMDEVERLGRPPMRPAAPRGRLLSRPPGSFALHRDPGGRFELSLPAEWTVVPGPPFFAHSPAVGSLAVVHVLDGAASLDAVLAAEWSAAGGTLLDVRARGERLTATLKLGGRTFDWTAQAKPSGSRRAVLSLGNVVDASRGPTLEAYEDRILAAIRRSFRVYLPSR